MDKKETFKVVQKVVAATPTTPGYRFSVTFLYPSSTIMLWVASSGTRMGAMSMSIPMQHGPAAVTRLQGLGAASDVSDRLAKLLCIKFKRQFFVMFSVASPPSMDAEKPEDLVMRSIFHELGSLLKDEDHLESVVEMRLMDALEDDAALQTGAGSRELSIQSS